jgi:hypothetical protein
MSRLRLWNVIAAVLTTNRTGARVDLDQMKYGQGLVADACAWK